MVCAEASVPTASRRSTAQHFCSKKHPREEKGLEETTDRDRWSAYYMQAVKSLARCGFDQIFTKCGDLMLRGEDAADCTELKITGNGADSALPLTRGCRRRFTLVVVRFTLVV